MKKTFKKIELNRMGNGYINYTLTNADIQEVLKIGAKVIEIHKGVVIRENFKITPSRKVIEKLFVLRQK